MRAARERRLTEHESQHRIDEIRQARGEENRADASGAPVRRAGRSPQMLHRCCMHEMELISVRWNYPRLGPVVVRLTDTDRVVGVSALLSAALTPTLALCVNFGRQL